MNDGNFRVTVQAESLKEGRLFADNLKQESGRKLAVIVLHCCHLDNPDPMDVRDENLAIFCQYHHRLFDRVRDTQMALLTKERKRKEREEWGRVWKAEAKARLEKKRQMEWEIWTRMDDCDFL